MQLDEYFTEVLIPLLNKKLKHTMKYYIYYNWQVRPANWKLHLDSCGHCNEGHGKNITSKTGGLHGVWIGAFEERGLAEDFASMIGINLSRCRCIK